MSCAICGKRPPKRFCPAKGEKICAICCGEGREVTIDCPIDCSYLISAHRYEAEHRKPIPAEEFPYRDIQIPLDFVYERWPVIAGIGETILRFQIENKELHDAAAISAIEALAETYRTLGTGIYYEHPPDATLARALYAQIASFLQEIKKEAANRADISALKDSEIFQLLVFLLRVGKQETNGRPLSRAFLGFLRARFPLPAEAAQETSRIIVP
ncbi:MAG TPA: hypothetical protein VK795_08595 [Terriglobales bacterium]|jgi:hypothetical protein|nr:hypothetical protein [Terriglobales bacterium]